MCGMVVTFEGSWIARVPGKKLFRDIKCLCI